MLVHCPPPLPSPHPTQPELLLTEQESVVYICRLNPLRKSSRHDFPTISGKARTEKIKEEVLNPFCLVDHL
jgi:hypothetical protein